MKLLPLDRPERFDLAAGWLARRENHDWLDFGAGHALITPALLKIMSQREQHFLRLFTGAEEGKPIGILGLNSVDRVFKSATFWGAVGEKSFASRGYSTDASTQFLTLGFRELGLRVINTWLVEHNQSRRIIERLGFRYVGRLRQCHIIDAQVRDRLMYDLLASEHAVRVARQVTWKQRTGARHYA